MDASVSTKGPSRGRRRLISTLRRLRLLGAVDAMRRFQHGRQHAADNAAFLAENPTFAAPPIDFVYEVTGQSSLRVFAASGRAACTALAELAEAHLPQTPRRVLDWGCGPARVARWWPTVRPGVEIHGGDPWPEAIAWGRTALPAVSLHQLPALPPTTFEPGFFDFVYGISILTHLTLDAQRAWLAEHRRIIRPGGVLALTLHGESAVSRLSEEERAAWAEGRHIERGEVREGSRLFLAYHPPAFVRDDLAADWELLKHEPDAPLASGGQDLWVFRRP